MWPLLELRDLAVTQREKHLLGFLQTVFITLLFFLKVPMCCKILKIGFKDDENFQTSVGNTSIYKVLFSRLADEANSILL